ncbi:ApeP family dehydratase [Paraglaciecola arctica]|uniref:ApeP family dehydratase n=1 Tax=Paraglaciecola arctica TaxID=1128911 RepID=UPI001C0702F2|nr:3-hydroxylacyl-ACP dehydratase [Paraglaciecola arctica]MBU3003499.1 3-hydroxylacyl-ACP dehydratase [Paraglaciecola arctica]
MNEYPIELVLPHAHPMILVDRLVHYTDMSSTCTVKITQCSNFYNPERNSVPSYVGIEYMAQTIAAYANVLKLDSGGKVSLGFLVSARNYMTQVREFALDTELLIQVELLFKEANGLSVFDCRIKQGEQVVVEAKINVFEPDEPELYLQEQAQK